MDRFLDIRHAVLGSLERDCSGKGSPGFYIDVFPPQMEGIGRYVEAIWEYSFIRCIGLCYRFLKPSFCATYSTIEGIRTFLTAFAH